MNPLVLKRFKELDHKAELILSGKRPSHRASDGSGYFAVDDVASTEWIVGVLNLLVRVCGKDSEHYKVFEQYRKQFLGYESGFRQLKAILDAAREDYENGYLFNMRGLIQAEVFDDALSQASELLAAGYKDPACVVAGVTLETTLKELCTRHGLAHGKLDKMNADLCKGGVFNMAMQKQITAWADRRNKAAHGDPAASNAADVDDMIRGVNRFIAENL